MEEAVGGALSEQGLSWPEYLALWVCSVRVGLSQQALAERIGVDRTRTSDTLQTLEQHGLVERGLGVDRRARVVRISDSGRAWFPRVQRDVEAAEREALLPLDPRERARVCALLGQLIADRRPSFLTLLR